MIPSSDHKSQQEVLDEFDRVFGGVSLTSENPTTSRRIEDKAVITLPSELSVSKVFDSLGRLLGERYLLILNHFYFRGLYRKKETKESGNWLEVHRNTLRKTGGEKYRSLLNYGLKEKHLLKSPAQYVVGSRCLAYMLNQEIFSLQTQQRYELTTSAAKRVWNNHSAERRAEFIQNGPVLEKIAESTDGLTFNYSAAIKHVSGLPEGEPKTRRQNLIESLIFGETTWAVDRQKRNYTTLVVVPRDIRPYFSHSQGPLFSIDIKSSQPLLHVLLYPEDCPEKQKYKTIVESGKFWDFINTAAGKPYDLSLPEQKDELKVAVFREVFYRHKEGKKGVSTLIATTFKKEFPILWAELNKAKAKGAKPLPREMQLNEAELIRDALNRIKHHDYPLITIHDCIVTTKEGLNDVSNSLRQSFKFYNLQPSLSVTPLTILSGKRSQKRS